MIFLASITWNNTRITGMIYDYPVDRVIREEAHRKCFGGGKRGIRKVVSDPNGV